MTGTQNFPPSGREVVYTALFGLLQTLLTTNTPTPGPFVTVSRRLKMWDQVPPEQQPALYMVDRKESHLQTGRGLPTRREWSLEFWIYAKVSPDANDTDCGSVILNNLLDTLDTLLIPKNGAPLQFGGQVYNSVLVDVIHKDPGDLDNQALSISFFKITPP